ncbi:MAG: GNAT family N-acetyltransferase [Treponema sp.]|nr:GNAT family N-acetyltransferase [Treponema sp.]
MNAENIRKAEAKDLSRIAEILVFAKRVKYRPIFNNDDYSFNELQVVKLVEEYGKPKILDNIWVYDDGIVKGMIHIEGKEIVELYVDYFFWNQGIGAKLIEFAKETHDARFLWVLEKNVDAIKFYEAHGFAANGKRQLEEGTPEYIIMLER